MWDKTNRIEIPDTVSRILLVTSGCLQFYLNHPPRRVIVQNSFQRLTTGLMHKLTSGSSSLNIMPIYGVQVVAAGIQYTSDFYIK